MILELKVNEKQRTEKEKEKVPIGFIPAQQFALLIIITFPTVTQRLSLF